MRLASAAALLAALAFAAPAAAHVVVSPSFVAAGETETLELTAPNERNAPMTGLAVTVPAGIEIEEALLPDGWSVEVEGRSVTWTGGRVLADLQETFELRIVANSEPGAVELDAMQLYADGGEVLWPVALTVVPGTGGDSRSMGLIAVILGVGVLVAAGVALLARRRGATGR